MTQAPTPEASSPRPVLRLPARLPRLILPLIALSILAMIAGCSGVSIPGAKAPPTDADVTEMAPGSLKVPVMEYNWQYLPGNNHVQIQGTVVNGEDRPLQGVMISLKLHDQDGTPIAYSDTYVTPTYLIPGAKGTFSVMALVSRGKGVTFTRLISNAQTRSVY